ncbi:hypothetical protein PSP6_200212 [Paraburkholderia tropica]|nr:hypothetical protein PSP6_200212 [Paraburkholderia tropica]
MVMRYQAYVNALFTGNDFHGYTQTCHATKHALTMNYIYAQKDQLSVCQASG